MVFEFDPRSTDNRADPFSAYRALREHARVYRAASGVYCVSHYEDVSFVMTHPDLFSSRGLFDEMSAGRWESLGLRDVIEMVRFLWRTRTNPLGLRMVESLVTSDPPRHGELRGIVNRGFTPRRIASWEPRIREIAQQCVMPLRQGKPLEIMRDLAVPVPVTVIAEMLGVEPERQQDFKDWSDNLISGSTGSQSIGIFVRGMGDLIVYLKGVVAARERNPADDLISVLVDPKHEDHLDAAAVIQFIVLLLVAGNETTTNLIGNAVKALIRNPDQLRKVQANPALVPGVVDETLRFDGPIQLLFRNATRDAELASTMIPKGESVCVLLGSANRDEKKFDNPDKFDIERDTRGHIGFGMGIHFCLGASLARLEARVVLEELIPLLSIGESTETNPPMVDSYIVRGPARLMLAPAAA